MEYWISKVKAIIKEDFVELEKELNEFYKDKFIVATQIFNFDKKWYAMVYYKIKEWGGNKMGTDVDVYGFEGTLEDYREQDWIKIVEDKSVGMVDFEKCPEEIKIKLGLLGYKEGDRVLVVIQ